MNAVGSEAASSEAVSPGSNLITPQDLAERLTRPGAVVLDATWTYPGGPTPSIAGAIPGAFAIAIDAVSDPDTALPHMLPSPAAFEAFARALGVDHDSDVIAYDRMGVVSAPRAWWMFRVMGCARVRVLDGGLPAWAESGGALAGAPLTPPAPTQGNFKAAFVDALYADRSDVQNAIDRGDVQILDVRAADRFAGAAPEPRPGVRAGHMPGARNAPWGRFVTPEGRVAGLYDLAAAFDRAGVSAEAPVITSCGSGVTACVAALALAELGRDDWAVYDGSWAEWGARDDTVVVQGAEDAS